MDRDMNKDANNGMNGSMDRGSDMDWNTDTDLDGNTDRTEVVAALFDTAPRAFSALEDLVGNGYDRQHINVIANDVAGEYSLYFDDDGHYIATEHDNTTAGEGAATGGGIGALLGGAGGVLAGLGLIAIPGIGPALAAGPIVAGLVGAGAGAVAGGLVGSLVNSGMPKENADKYAEGVRRGGTLLLLRTEPGDLTQEAHRILNAHQPVDIDERAHGWEDTGWRDFRNDAAPLTQREIMRERERRI